jgi:hypothetical protein
MPEAEPAGLANTLKTAAHRLAAFPAWVVLTAVYYLALGPAALFNRLMKDDALGLRGGSTGWTKREPVEPAEHLRGQG